VSEPLEETAQKIAARGREALLARLRPVFAELAGEHADALPVDDLQLEQMVQSAADRADGVQWRCALATAASEELGIGLGEALAHPAVARAQALVGAPSFEDALAGPATPRITGIERGVTKPEPGEHEPVRLLTRRERLASMLGRYRR
jgi:hypothetical protein